MPEDACVCVFVCANELVNEILRRCALVENMWLLSPQSHVDLQSACQSSVIAGKANGMGQRRDYKAACFSNGVSPAGLHGPSSLCLQLTR